MTIIIDTASKIGVDSKEIQKFYELYWPRKTVLSIDDFYQWQFIQPPTANGSNFSVVAIDTAKQALVGVMGVTPRTFYLNQLALPAVELTTWILQPRYRGKQIAINIINYLEKYYDVIIGLGVSDLTLSITYRKCARFLSGIPRFIKVFNWKSVRKFSNVAPMAIIMARSWDKMNHFERYCLVSINDSDIEAINYENQKNFNFFDRNAAHIRWRYDKHPVFSYKYFMVSTLQSTQKVFICLREEATVPGFRMLHIIDCIGSESALPAAISFIEEYARDNYFDAVDFFCTSATINKYFLARGWFSTLDDKLLEMPHLFHPVELRNPATTSIVYWTRHHYMNDLCDLSRLYISKQDVDFDRPTNLNLNIKNNSSSQTIFY